MNAATHHRRGGYLVTMARLVTTGAALGLLVCYGSGQARAQRSPDDQSASKASTHGQQANLEGEVVRAENGQIVIRDDNHTRHTERLAEDARITLNGHEAEVRDLRVGDRVQVRTSPDNQSEAVAIDATRERHDAYGSQPAAEREDQNAEQESPAPERRSTAQRSRREEPAGLGVLVARRIGGEGIRVLQVYVDSPAAKAGIRRGDVLLLAGEEPITSENQLARFVRQKSPGTKIELTLTRDGQQKTVSATLEPRQEAFAEENNQEQGTEREARGSEGEEPGFGRGQQGVERERPRESAGQRTAWLGVRLREAPEGQQGVEIRNIYPNGPADLAGLRPGDLLLRINNQQVESPDDAASMLDEMRPGQRVEMTIRREGRRQTISATLGSPDDFRSRRPAARETEETVAPQSTSIDEQRSSSTDEQQPSSTDEQQPTSLSGHNEQGSDPMLEMQRYMAEQHERIERQLNRLTNEVKELSTQGDDPEMRELTELRRLTNEVVQLRKEVAQLRGGSSAKRSSQK